MRKYIVLVAMALAWGCATALHPANAATFSWRFAGLNAVRENKDLVTWREISGLPEFGGFNSNLVQRISASLAKTLAHGGENESDLAKLLTPIAADLVAYPTVYELKEEGTNGKWALAIQIPNERHDAWKKSWDAISKTSKDEAKLSREGNWTVLGNGDTKAVLDRAKQPATDVLQISGDALVLQKLLPGLKPTKTELRVSTRGKGLRTEGKVQFEQDLPFKLTAWQIPTNTIRDPLIAFTAVQGLSDHLGKLEFFKKHPAPNQVFIWSEAFAIFAMNAAFKVDNARQFVRDAADVVVADKTTTLNGRLEFDTNRYGLYVMGLPVAIPYLRPAHSNDVNFVMAGAMPMSAFSTNSFPAELAREVVTRTNLVYYDWELSGMRLAQIRPLTQVYSMATSAQISEFADQANKWLQAAEQKLGNTISEISKTGPRELSFVRSSDSGLSAIEWFELVQWIAGPPHPAPKGRGKPHPAAP